MLNRIGINLNEQKSRSNRDGRARSSTFHIKFNNLYSYRYDETCNRMNVFFNSLVSKGKHQESDAREIIIIFLHCLEVSICIGTGFLE